jgi:predicted MPP superfamily phosphohydrolase
MLRRSFLKQMGFGAAAAAGAGLFYAWRIEPTWVEVVERDMPIPDLPSAFAGFKLVQLSDLHFGSDHNDGYLLDCADRVNSYQPDLVVVTGDLVHNGRAECAERVCAMLSRLEAAEGVLAILGNHDYASMRPGEARVDVAHRVAHTIREASRAELLQNAHYPIRRGGAALHVVGLDEFWSPRFDPGAAFANVPAGEPCVALIHNPDAFVEMLDCPAQWFLAGHTHGGQVCLPLIGPPLLPIQHREFAAGHFVRKGKNLYVNKGLGWIKRIRFNARPEITVFTLTST